MLFLKAFQTLNHSKFHTEKTKFNLIVCQNLILYLQFPFNYWSDKSLSKIKVISSPESILPSLLQRAIPFLFSLISFHYFMLHSPASDLGLKNISVLYERILLYIKELQTAKSNKIIEFLY